MAWEDRLKPAKYTAPSGAFVEFDYENVSRSIEKKTGEFSFPDALGSLMQDSGSRGRKYPVTAIFWGEDYDLQALLFEDLLSEQGVGKLEHPLYGTFDVVPSGTITRRDDLKNGANQATVTVTFVDTSGAVFDPTGFAYDSSQENPSAAVTQSVEEYNAASAEQYGEAVDTETASERVSLKSTYQTLKNAATSALDSVAAATETVQKQFDTIDASINAAIDTLIGRPLDLAFQTNILLQAPARSAALIQDRLNAYGNLADSITQSSPINSNDFRTSALFGEGYITGLVTSALNNEFETKPEAINAAVFILEKFDELNDWRDSNFEAFGEIDTGESYQKIQEAVAVCAGFLVQISFTLKQERVIELDRDRNIVELVAELYGETDTILDFFINSNDLTGSEILELSRGREIVYYV